MKGTGPKGITGGMIGPSTGGRNGPGEDIEICLLEYNIKQ